MGIVSFVYVRTNTEHVLLCLFQVVRTQIDLLINILSRLFFCFVEFLFHMLLADKVWAGAMERSMEEQMQQKQQLGASKMCAL